MPLIIDGERYYLATEILAELSVSRQTFWRWRREGKIPQGCRDRARRVLFTAPELDAIRAHANFVEPIQPVNKDQLPLFGDKRRSEHAS
jgi:predicted DNA-binding transcriptional regulator AlpA